jgi:hypothetical protein
LDIRDTHPAGDPWSVKAHLGLQPVAEGGL